MTPPRRRASRGMTYDPCDGCHGERQTLVTYTNDPDGEHSHMPQRHKGSVCGACSSLLAHASTIIARHSEAQDALRGQVFQRHPKVRGLLRLRDEIGSGFMHDEGGDVQDAIVAIAIATGLPVSRENRTHERYGGMAASLVPYDNERGSSAPTRLYSIEQIDAFERLVEAMETGLVSAYRRGHARGADLLARLAAGDLTVFEYDAERNHIAKAGDDEGEDDDD